jgi:hypothetical protein
MMWLADTRCRCRLRYRYRCILYDYMGVEWKGGERVGLSIAGCDPEKIIQRGTVHETALKA